MRFSAASLVTLGMVSLVMALPYDTQAAEHDVSSYTAPTTDGIVYPSEDDELVARSIDYEDGDAAVNYPVAEEGEVSTTLKTRQVGLAIEIAAAIIPLAMNADKYVQGIINKDIERRKQFTQRTVGDLRRKFPRVNFVMCNVGYKFNGDQVSKKTVFYHNTIGKKVSFDVIAFKRGTFDRDGDGGFQNWAYTVNSGCQKNGGHIQC